MLVHCSKCGHPNQNVHCCDGIVASCETGVAQPCERCEWDVMQSFQAATNEKDNQRFL